MPRSRITLRALLAAACFFGGIHFERERQRRADEAAALAAKARAIPYARLVDVDDLFEIVQETSLPGKGK